MVALRHNNRNLGTDSSAKPHTAHPRYRRGPLLKLHNISFNNTKTLEAVFGEKERAMFSKQRMMNGKLQLVLVLALALVMLVPAISADAASSATASGDFCVDGLVIDWEEEVIEEGWFVEALPVDDNGNVGSCPLLVAYPSEEDDEEGQFEFNDEQFRDADGNLISENWEFTIVFTEAYTDSEGNEVAPLVGNWEGVTPTTITVPFEYGADECVRIRFKLRELVSVLAIKMDSKPQTARRLEHHRQPRPRELLRRRV